MFMNINDLAQSNNPGFAQAQLECFGRSEMSLILVDVFVEIHFTNFLVFTK